MYIAIIKHYGNDKEYNFKTSLGDLEYGEEVVVKTQFGYDTVVFQRYGVIGVHKATKEVIGRKTNVRADLHKAEPIVEKAKKMTVTKRNEKQAVSVSDRLRNIVRGAEPGDILELERAKGSRREVETCYLIVSKNAQREWVALNLSTAITWRAAGKTNDAMFDEYFGNKVGTEFLDIVLHKAGDINLQIA